jgi:hypothetical protein
LANKYSPYPGDIVDAKLEPGEYVLNRNAVKAIGKENLNMLNHEVAPRFAEGGSVDKEREAWEKEHYKKLSPARKEIWRDTGIRGKNYREMKWLNHKAKELKANTNQTVTPIDLQKIEIHDVPGDEFNVDDFNKMVGNFSTIAKSGYNEANRMRMEDASIVAQGKQMYEDDLARNKASAEFDDGILPGIDLKNWKGPQSPFRATEAEQYAYQLQKDPRMLGFDLNKKQRSRIEKANPYLKAERLKGAEKLRSQYGSTASQMKAEDELAMDKIRAKIKGDLDSKQLLEEQNKAIAMMNPSGAPSKPQMLPGIPYETMENYIARMEALDKKPKKQLAMKDIKSELDKMKVSKVASTPEPEAGKTHRKSLRSGLGDALRNFRGGYEKGRSRDYTINPELYAQGGTYVTGDYPELDAKMAELEQEISGLPQDAAPAVDNRPPAVTMAKRWTPKDFRIQAPQSAFSLNNPRRNIQKPIPGAYGNMFSNDMVEQYLGEGDWMTNKEWDADEASDYHRFDKGVLDEASKTGMGKLGYWFGGKGATLADLKYKADTLQSKSDAITYDDLKNYVHKGEAENYEDVLRGKEKGSLWQRGGKGLGMLSSLLTYASGSGQHNLGEYGRYKPLKLTKRHGGFISDIGHYQDGGHVSMNNSRRLFDMARRNYGRS